VKDLRPLSDSIAAGGWREAGTKVRDVAGLRLDLLGAGAIGRAVAGLARAFGMTVLAFDPAAANDGIARAATPVALFAESDAISVHCPLTPETRHLVDAGALATMPPGGYLVNTARGGIVDEAALLAALESGHLAGAALDVFENEPPGASHPLRRHPRVIVTPHVAGVTDGSLVNMGVMAAECIVAALTGGTVPQDRIVGPDIG
jgi:D-3-phosphoglycerate dehydrogenase